MPGVHRAGGLPWAVASLGYRENEEDAVSVLRSDPTPAHYLVFLCFFLNSYVSTMQV